MIALDVAGSLDVSNTARIYAREALAGDDVALDVENVPRAELTLEWPTTALELDYAPHLFWSEINGPEPAPMSLLHTASVRLSSRAERLTVSIGQTLAVGEQSFARLSREPGALASDPAADPAAPAGVGTAPSPELDLLPGPAVVSVFETESSASVRYELSRRVSTEVRPSFGVSGGADRASRRVLPRERTARVDLSLDYRATARDVLTSSAGVMHSSISTGHEHRVVSAMETWTHMFRPATGIALGAGAAVSDSTRPDDTTNTELRPIGLGRAWHTMQARTWQVELRSEVGHRPDVNVLTGSLQGQLYATAGATASAGSTSVHAGLGAAQTLPPQEPDSALSLTADLVLEQGLFSWLSAELGAQITWQSLGRGSVLEQSDALWLLFAGARAELPSVRF